MYVVTYLVYTWYTIALGNTRYTAAAVRSGYVPLVYTCGANT